MFLLMLAWLAVFGLVAPAHAATPGTIGGGTAGAVPSDASAASLGPSPDAAWKDKSKDEKEKEMTAAEKEAERKRKEKLARVIVLKWPRTSTDYTDSTVQRNVRSRIARPEAQFFPEVDLYQNGRKVRDKSVVPAMQPAAVPDQNLERVRAAIAEIQSVPWNGMQPDAWGIKANELRDMVEQIWFVDKVEQREPLFLLYTQIGRAAENQNQNIPPFFEQIGSTPVNYYFYLAATLAYQDPALMSKLTDQELNGQVAAILQQLQQGGFPNLKIDFELEGEDFKLEDFNKTYELYLNGIKTDLNDNGQYDIFLGRTDIYLKRTDSGHGLSERLEVTKLEDKIYFVRDTARKKMGTDFIQQLFLHPNECTPNLDGDILNYLAIYAKIHEKAEIYIAVPKEGNPNKVWVWRYDRSTANLQLVGGGNDGFPVRFAAVVSAGIMYNGATPSFDSSQITETPNGNVSADDLENNDPVGDLIQANKDDPSVALNAAYIPLNFELRGHYNRLMVSMGIEGGFNTGGSEHTSKWAENYWLPGHIFADVAKLDKREATPGVDADGDGKYDGPDDTPPTYEYVGEQKLYHTSMINRDLYMGVAVVIGRDAGIGFGPRIGMRVGWTNIPHALQTTAHVGWTLAAPLIKPPGNRIRPLLDIDGRIGASWPFQNSIEFDDTKLVTIKPVFGITGGVGTTF
jgi:hypothetical protein